MQNKNRTPRNAHRRERGQAIVLVAAAMIALIAMLGLAIDGGGLYFLNRDVQNATDAAVFAVTYAKCSNGSDAQIEAAARKAAADNGFVHGEDGVIVTVQSPPDGYSGPASLADSYIQVSIQAEKQPFFIQVVHDGPLTVRASGVGRCAIDAYAEGDYAIFATAVGCGKNLSLTGSSFVVDPGGVHSNSAIQFPNSGNTEVSGNVTAADTGSSSGSPTPESSPIIPAPALYSVDDYDQPTDSIVTTYGLIYYNNLVPSKNNQPINIPTDIPGWNPNITEIGLIYVDGEDVQITPKDFDSTKTYYLTVVNSDGTIEIDGGVGGGVNIKSYLRLATGEKNSLLFFTGLLAENPCSATANNSMGIDMGGNDVNLSGIVYAPHAGITASNADFDIEGAIIGSSINLSGSTGNIIYNESFLPDPRRAGSVAE